jgi:hypothetical protein
MKEFGSLVWITVSITRKLVTIMLSLLIFKHSVNGTQLLGIFFAASGMLLEIVLGYKEKAKAISAPETPKDIKSDSSPSPLTPEARGSVTRRVTRSISSRDPSVLENYSPKNDLKKTPSKKTK